jgi:hypothetical protein
MLFLYRPRETWMPFARPMSGSQQAAYNRQLQAQFASTRRVAPALPAPQRDVTGGLERLNALHSSGALTDAEYESAKARLLAS